MCVCCRRKKGEQIEMNGSTPLDEVSKEDYDFLNESELVWVRGANRIHNQVNRVFFYSNFIKFLNRTNNCFCLIN